MCAVTTVTFEWKSIGSSNLSASSPGGVSGGKTSSAVAVVFGQSGDDGVVVVINTKERYN